MLLSVAACSPSGSVADEGCDASVDTPKLQAAAPVVCFDESHKNHHKISTTYAPFARLIANDGCRVRSTDQPISASTLAGVAVYVIPTAMGREDPGDIPPFTPEEIDQLEAWVAGGGSALIITEHYPFGLAMAPLLAKFGVTVHNGYTEDPPLENKEVRDALLFEKSKGNLNAAHPIFEQVERVNTFTGSSVKGGAEWTPLLLLSPAAKNYNVKVDVKREGGDIITSVEYAEPHPAAGYAQGLCAEHWRGRIVVLAESALLTAQIDKNGNKYGFNNPGYDNKRFALNVIRWLTAR